MLAHHLAADGVSIGLAQLYWLRAYRSLCGEAEPGEGDDDGLESSGAEPTLAPEGRVVLRDLVEEEILLAAPLVPRHEDVAGCGPGEAIPADTTPGDAKKGPMNTPFAGLGELLKRGH